MNAEHTHRTIGKGAAVHVVLASSWTACGRQGVYGEPVTTGATCKACERRAPELMKPTAAAPVEAPKPKAKRKAKAKKAAKPKATTRTEPTKVFAAAHNAEAAAAIPGVRWASVVRATGALTASVNCAEYGLVDAADKWMALCVTHDEQEFHPTHRAAWTARRRSADWCSGCRSVAAAKDEEAGK
ncbi:hypothetical protein [Streptomyces spiralis]